jgi:integrase
VLDKASIAALKAWRKRQAAEQLAAGDRWAGGRVFTQPDGRAYHPDRLTDMFQRHAFDVALPPVRLHDARHLAATLAHAAGGSMKDIQAMLRHASYAITAQL